MLPTMESEYSQNPFTAMVADQEKALSAGDPNARLLSLATASGDGVPSTRVVVLRGIDSETLIILTSRLHQKWKDLNANRICEALVWWSSINVQYRCACSWRELSDAYRRELWGNISEKSRRLDVAYDHGFIPGQELKDRAALIEMIETIQLPDTPPAHVVGISLETHTVERLEVSPEDRLHQRTKFIKQNGVWARLDLIP